jgi:hypothetical protein
MTMLNAGIRWCCDRSALRRREAARKSARGEKVVNRKTFLKSIGSAALLPMLPRPLRASTTLHRRRPSDADWPSSSAWKRLNDAVGGNLLRVDFPLTVLKTDPTGSAA